MSELKTGSIKGLIKAVKEERFAEAKKIACDLERALQIKEENEKIGEEIEKHEQVWESIKSRNDCEGYSPDYINAKNKEQKTVLHRLADNPKPDITLIKKLVLLYGANVNAEDEDGNTPLICAARSGNAELCKLLVDTGANAAHKNKQGWSAFLVAVQVCSISERHREVCEFLNLGEK